MIVQGLITYRNVFLRSNAPKLEDIRTKLAEIAVRESAEQLDGDLIEEVVEKINQREPDVIREMRCHFCLLYTSPSPRDRQKSRMPSSA